MEVKISPYRLDTERKLNANKTFKRRPGCYLNVLCTLNLRPVLWVSGTILQCSKGNFGKFIPQ